MKTIVVLAFSGGAAIGRRYWVARRPASRRRGHGHDRPRVSARPADIRRRRARRGALRAHVIDAREEFAREYRVAVAEGRRAVGGALPDGDGADAPLIAKKLVRSPRIENATDRRARRDRPRCGAASRQPSATLEPGAARRSPSPTKPDFDRSKLATRVNRVDDNLWGRTIGRRADEGCAQAAESLFKADAGASRRRPSSPAYVDDRVRAWRAAGHQRRHDALARTDR